MKRRLRDLLTDISDKPVKEQYNLIKLEFHQWKANRNQVDDVCLMGIRVLCRGLILLKFQTKA